MKPRHEWEALFFIAEQDRKALHVLFQTDVILSVSCFHAQQAVEKHLKAVLSKRKIPFPFTHDLTELHDIFTMQNVTLPVDRIAIKKLNPFAVQQRYDIPPETSATIEEVAEIVDSVADWCKKQLHD